MTQVGRMEGMLQALTLTLLPEGEGTPKKGWFGGLWQDPDFAKFWVSRTVSNFGTLMGALQFVAVLVLGATPFQMGVLVALGVAPSIVIGFFAGVIADRIRRRPILIVSELGRFALMASIPVVFLIGQLRIEQLYVVVFFNGVLTTFFDVANRSYLPTLVNRSELVDANSRADRQRVVRGSYGVQHRWLDSATEQLCRRRCDKRADISGVLAFAGVHSQARA